VLRIAAIAAGKSKIKTGTDHPKLQQMSFCLANRLDESFSLAKRKNFSGGLIPK